MKSLRDNPIGVLDSGIGGISTLNKLKEILPNEDFIFYADHKYAPYGDRDIEDVKKIVWNIVNFFLKQNVKAIVIACNTATSAVAKELRKSLDIPILGLEPAIKPAIKMGKKDILIMATVLTLKGEKFNNLVKKVMLENSSSKKIKKIPAKGLVELIESDKFSKKITQYLKNLFLGIKLDNYSSLVLGCTHYIFIKDQIKEIIGENINIIDGNLGVSQYLKSILIKNNMDKKTKGSIKIISSGNQKDLDRCYKFLD